MNLIPLDIPPGMLRGGTELESAGRWRDGSLVRWKEGILQPVGGWITRASSGALNPPRGALAWRDNQGDRRIAFGTADKLFVMGSSNIVTDITPAGLVVGSPGAAAITGYGGGFYGLGAYGTPRAATGSLQAATTWALDTWGQDLVACSSADGRLFQWSLNPVTPAAPITNAPIDCAALLVTEERFLFALGAGGNPRRVQWSDRENNTIWAPQATNQAGDIDLQTEGAIQCGVRTRGQALILTDVDAHTATYVGGTFVYGFERVGSGCGVIGPLAAASTDMGVMWMGRRGFFRFAGGAVEAVPCEVSEAVFGELNQQQATRAHAMPMRSRNEVWFFYPGPTGEVTRYVIYNYVEGHWSLGSLARTCGVDGAIFGSPLMLGANGVVYEHENGFSYGGAQAPFVESGPIQIGAGEVVMHATELIPDERTQGAAVARFTTRFHPNNTLYEHGPYAMANPTSVRFTGRQVAMRIEGSPGADWRVGIPRLRVFTGGYR